MISNNVKYRLRNVKRICSILDCFIATKRELSLAEICNLTKFKKSVVFRILINLEEEGFLTKNIKNKKYFLGIKLFQLGNIITRNLSLLNQSIPVMEALSKQTKENVYLYKLNEYKRICI